MHTHQVIHRDLKLGNIFLDRDMNVQVGDFGLAALIETPGDRKKLVILPITNLSKFDSECDWKDDLWNTKLYRPRGSVRHREWPQLRSRYLVDRGHYVGL